MHDNIKLNFSYYLPKYKQMQGLLTNSIVGEKLKQAAKKIRNRVLKLLYLKQIHDKKKINKDKLKLSEPAEKYKNILEQLKPKPETAEAKQQVIQQ
jgi:uncharacterized radical SAM superfamily protein